MNDKIFEPAIQQMVNENVSLFGLTSFQDYLTENSLPFVQTAKAISVDSIESIDES